MDILSLSLVLLFLIILMTSNEKRGAKIMTYKTKNLNFYVTDCISLGHAVFTLLRFRIGVTENDVKLFEGQIPIGATVFNSII